jgi:VCBS repeat-containing protein
MKRRSPGLYVIAAALILAIGVPSAAVGFGEGRDAKLGKRNPSSGSLTRETQIIANNGSYGTRQSNKRNGEGGGAIYGCRSEAGKEPCVRANNLKGGRAFEFATVGKEAGFIQVGDTSAPPFSTNATGKVTNLDADKVDGKSSEEFASAGDLGFVSVKADGTFVAGRGATASALTSAEQNTYTITFNKDVSKCSFTANAVGVSSANGFGVEPVAGAVTQVRVDQQDDDAGPPPVDRGRDFHLQAIC